jgi:hypothetical protein
MEPDLGRSAGLRTNLEESGNLRLQQKITDDARELLRLFYLRIMSTLIDNL